jgi:hypothetical protein
LSATSIVAISTPSRSRSAIVSPSRRLSAKAWLTSSVTGIGQSSPSARRMRSTTLS